MSPDYMIRDGATYRLIRDFQGSVRLVVNADTGAVAQRIDYDAFGNVVAAELMNSGTNELTNFSFQPFGFQSGLYDSDTGLVHFGARWFDPATGRWISKDPILLAGGLNLYVFCGNDPVNFSDPSGLCEVYSPNFIATMQTIADFIEKSSKYKQAKAIANRVQAEWTGLDDFGDAMRHAEWNRQMAVEIGSARTWLYGTGHEITGWFDQGDLDAMRMDLQNNRTGRLAGSAGVAIPVDDLVWIVNAPPGREPTYGQLRLPLIWTMGIP